MSTRNTRTARLESWGSAVTLIGVLIALAVVGVIAHELYGSLAHLLDGLDTTAPAQWVSR